MANSQPRRPWSPAEMFMRKLSEAALADKKAKLEEEIDDVLMEDDTAMDQETSLVPIEIDGVSNDKGVEEIDLLVSYLLRDRARQNAPELRKLLQMAVDKMVERRVTRVVRKELRKWRKIDPSQVQLFKTEKED